MTTSYVVVIGLGGVGSHAASMLLRSGVGRLLLVDFDQVLFVLCPSFILPYVIGLDYLFYRLILFLIKFLIDFVHLSKI